MLCLLDKENRRRDCEDCVRPNCKRRDDSVNKNCKDWIDFTCSEVLWCNLVLWSTFTLSKKKRT